MRLCVRRALLRVRRVRLQGVSARPQAPAARGWHNVDGHDSDGGLDLPWVAPFGYVAVRRH